MFAILDSLPATYMLAFAGGSLGFLALISRIDRSCARNDRAVAVQIYRRAAAKYRLATDALQTVPETFADHEARLRWLEVRESDREAETRTAWERMGISAGSVG